MKLQLEGVEDYLLSRLLDVDCDANSALITKRTAKFEVEQVYIIMERLHAYREISGPFDRLCMELHTYRVTRLDQQTP